MSQALTRSERLREMERLYTQRAFSDIEMGERLGVDRTTVYRDRRLLAEEEQVPFVKDDNRRWRIDRTRYLSAIRVNLHEALALYLAARRMSRRTHIAQPHVAAALSKLAATLGQPMAEKLVAAADSVLSRQGDLKSVAVLETVAQSWAHGRKVRLTYQALGREDSVVHVVHPYLIEPALWSEGAYVVAFSETMNKLVPFRISRIVRADLKLDSFVVPETFDEEELLRHAWGIWAREGDPMTVRLRFRPGRAARRVGEDVWHPLQEIEVLEDGSCIWQAPIDDWREMVPWIRGWGPDVEVLEPQDLRHEIIMHIQQMTDMYELRPAATKSAVYAHSRNARGVRHLLTTHLEEVAEMAARFATPLHASDLARYLGLWHDLGKYHPGFQQYLREVERPDNTRRRGPDHKAAGVSLAIENGLGLAALLLQGHHGGLKNRSDLKRWYAKVEDEAATALSLAREAMDLAPHEPPLLPNFARENAHSAEFFLRMLFSTLVDADFLDTESHFSPDRGARRDSQTDVATFWQQFDQDQQERFGGAADTAVNRSRREIYRACLDAAGQPPGLYRLTVPTGGGKTRSGMAFALRHAAQHGQRRVIVAVPYITITQQTAGVYRSIFEGDGSNAQVVLEHHSGAAERAEDSDQYRPRDVWRRLAAENWDAPIVVTTTVQLFESMFANSTSQCRKLHRLANSVIILDEAQSLPAHLLEPMLDGLHELCLHYGTTVVLSTATQPAFNAIGPFRDLSLREIVPYPERHFEALKRVRYEWLIDEPLSWEGVAALMRSEPQALAICNTKQDALDLLDALGDPNALHLSTLLCGKHRSAVIREVLQRLEAGAPCRLIATQVVEAGVDIDFPLVLRALGPLDSIVQAAGRANREGKLPQGRVIVFAPVAGGLPPGAYKRATQTTRTMLNAGALDMHDPTVMQRYFTSVYQLEETDSKRIQKKREELDYPEVAERFRIIDDDTVSVVIRTYGDAEERRRVRAILSRLRVGAPPTRYLLRQLQPYTVSIWKHQADKYVQQGWLSPQDEDGIAPGLWEWTGAYDAVRGLTATNMDADRIVF